MTRTVTIVEQATLPAGVVFLKTLTEGLSYNGSPFSYHGYDLEGLEGEDLAQLAQLATVLQNLPEDGALDLSQGELEDYIKEWAADTAEGAELPFTYTDSVGKAQTYTPASLWESSGGCEWETSAQEGYDYGWNV